MDVLIYKRFKIIKSYMSCWLFLWWVYVMVNFVFRIYCVLLIGIYIYIFRIDNWISYFYCKVYYFMESYSYVWKGRCMYSIFIL